MPRIINVFKSITIGNLLARFPSPSPHPSRWLLLKEHAFVLQIDDTVVAVQVSVAVAVVAVAMVVLSTRELMCCWSQ